MRTRGRRCGMTGLGGSLDRHATYIVAAYIAGAAREATPAGSSSAWRPQPPGGQPSRTMNSLVAGRQAARPLRIVTSTRARTAVGAAA